ncbi:MAG: flippase-like domain-containing protein [Fibromonadales bacterium]|nr:flippase-like domain-containing protein [Fibromonadales bacterium]
MKNFIIFFLKLVVSATLCFFVWKSISATPVDIEDVEYKFLFFAVSCIFLSYLSGCLQWKLLLAKQNVSMTYVKLVRFYFVGCFFNNFMPGNVGGDIKKIYDINRNSKETVGAAVSATVLDRLCGLYVLCGFALAVGVAFFWQDPEQKYFLLPSLLVFSVFSIGLYLLFSRKLGKLLSFFGRRILHLHGRFQAFRTKKLFAQIFSLSVVTQSFRVLSHYFCGLAIGVDISVSWYFYYVPLIAIVSALPISIGGFGPREFMAQSLFARVGVEPMEAVLVQLLAYGANLAVSLLGAIDFLFKHFSILNKSSTGEKK